MSGYEFLIYFASYVTEGDVIIRGSQKHELQMNVRQFVAQRLFLIRSSPRALLLFSSQITPALLLTLNARLAFFAVVLIMTIFPVDQHMIL